MIDEYQHIINAQLYYPIVMILVCLPILVYTTIKIKTINIDTEPGAGIFIILGFIMAWVVISLTCIVSIPDMIMAYYQPDMFIDHYYTELNRCVVSQQ